MRSRIFLLFTFIFATSLLFAQRGSKEKSTPFFLVGSVQDAETNAALEYATITVLNASDSSFVGGTITQPTGEFEIEATAGSYLLKLEFIGYSSKIMGPYQVNANAPRVQVGTVTLKSKSEMLKEAVVTAERSQVALSLEKKTFEVGKDLSSIGGSATDVLENVPSVTVDADGSVSLRGNGNVRILINGKQSGLLGISGTEALQMFPADQIERVEVITNPSARYDAEGMAGIINIILKEEKEKGTNGVFSLSAGSPQMFNGSANISHQKGKFTYSLGYSFRNRSFGGFRNEKRTIFGSETDTILTQDGDNNRAGDRHGITGGVQFQPNKSNLLIINGNYRISDGFNTSDVDYKTTNSAGQRLSSSRRTNDETEDEEGFDISLDYTKRFKKEGQEWVTTVNFNQSDEIEDTDSEERIFDNQNNLTRTLLQHSYNHEFQQNGVFQSDFVLPLQKEQKLEFGVKSSLRVIETDYFVEEFNNVSGEWSTLDGVSNQFVYNENIHAAYGMYSKKWKKLSMLAGVRFEYSDILTEQKETNEKNKRDYVDPFPTVHVSYEIDKVNSLQISYSRRIRRPNFWNLNPFFSFTNPVSFQSGNPNINPEYTNSMEFSYLAFKNKWNINASVYYRHSTDVIQWISTIRDSITFTRPENVAQQQSYGLELTGSYRPADWWKLNGTLNMFGSTLDASNVENGREISYLSSTFQLSSMMTILKKYDLQIRGNYQAPQEMAQGERKEIAYMDVAVTRDILKGKATLSFKVNDVFNSRYRRSTSNGENFTFYSERQWRPRMVTAGFTYRLNQENKPQRGGNRGGSDDGGEM